MKKLLILILLMLISDVYAQKGFFSNRKLRRELSIYAFGKDDGVRDLPNLFITNLLTKKMLIWRLIQLVSVSIRLKFPVPCTLSFYY